MTDAAIKRTRLFARLLCDEYERRSVIDSVLHAPTYLRFLRGERRQHKCYPLALRALKTIEAAA